MGCGVAFVPGRKVQRRRDGRKIVGVKGTGRVLPGTGQSAGCAVRADGLGEGEAAWRICAEQEAFYYRARQVAEREQRAQMGRELTARFEVMLQKYTYEEYFNRVKSGDPTKLVVVIDEFQYIAKKDPTFMEAVLKLKAHRLYPGPVMILLCSSAVSWAERELAECIGEGGMPQNRPENQIYESEFSGSGVGAARVSGGGMYQDLRHHRRCAGIHQPLERKKRM